MTQAQEKFRHLSTTISAVAVRLPEADRKELLALLAADIANRQASLAERMREDGPE